MLKVFVGRDSHRQLFADRLNAFRALPAMLAERERETTLNTLLIFGAGSGVALHIQQLLASGEGRGKVFALCDTTPEGERF
nr:hypothetical protein [Rahnella perminowiae]